jgi:hypothetical protein
MAVESNYYSPDGGHRPGDVELLLNEVQELTWALLDDNIGSEEFARLEQVLSDEDAARQAYLDCVQLHVDLHEHFAEEPATSVAGAGRSPLLGFLDDVPLPLDVRPPHPNGSGC